MSRDKAEIIAYAIRKECQKCYWYETYGITFDEFEEFLSNGILNNARIHITVEELQRFIDEIKALEQSPKTGHWIVVVDKWGDKITTVSGYRCSECNAFNTDEDNYCPNCGSKMQAESEGEYGKNES